MGGGTAGDGRSASGGGRTRLDAADKGEAAGEGERERERRQGAEEEREALRRMCNGLAVDLKEAVEARAEAEGDRGALLQVGASVLLAR